MGDTQSSCLHGVGRLPAREPPRRSRPAEWHACRTRPRETRPAALLPGMSQTLAIRRDEVAINSSERHEGPSCRRVAKWTCERFTTRGSKWVLRTDRVCPSAAFLPHLSRHLVGLGQELLRGFSTLRDSQSVQQGRGRAPRGSLHERGVISSLAPLSRPHCWCVVPGKTRVTPCTSSGCR